MIVVSGLVDRELLRDVQGQLSSQLQVCDFLVLSFCARHWYPFVLAEHTPSSRRG